MVPILSTKERPHENDASRGEQCKALPRRLNMSTSSPRATPRWRDALFVERIGTNHRLPSVGFQKGTPASLLQTMQPRAVDASRRGRVEPGHTIQKSFNHKDSKT